MGSATISKIEKAIQYAHERDRFEFKDFTVKLRGLHSTHTVVYREGKLSCDCEHFIGHGDCSHTIACEKVLGTMVPGAISMLTN
ncbi:MAG TPA: hypothetical protein VJG32_03550 [Anaerolineae bacterium]|nr:hypothetical protein [Anaerolineae bacterium]